MALLVFLVILWNDLQTCPILLKCIYGKSIFAHFLSKATSLPGGEGNGKGWVRIYANEFYLKLLSKQNF